MNGVRRVLPLALLLVASIALPARAAPGDLDPSFDSGGTSVTPCVGHRCGAAAVAIDGRGRLVVAGAIGRQLFVARYTRSGGLDTSFGTNGRTTTSRATGAAGMVLTPNGRIVVLGQQTASFVLMRLRPTGQPD